MRSRQIERIDIRYKMRRQLRQLSERRPVGGADLPGAEAVQKRPSDLDHVLSSKLLLSRILRLRLTIRKTK